MEKIEFKEIVELFFNDAIKRIKEDKEVPNINFQFDFDFLETKTDEVLTLYVRDSYKFFQLLTEIVNALVKLYFDYNIIASARSLAFRMLRQIWLRMGIEDLNNVELFLNKELQFINDRTLDTYLKQEIAIFNNRKVFKKTILNNIWCETNRSMVFLIQDETTYYELPHVLYEIDASNICYIYAVQNNTTIKNKKITRELYRLNKNIENPIVHPNKIYAILLFIEELKKQGIFKIKIPSMQILSYHYHELLSQDAWENMKKVESMVANYPDDEYSKHLYTNWQNWFNHVYEKQDKISYLKTEELIYLMYIVCELNSNIEIENEINIEGDSLNLHLKC